MNLEKFNPKKVQDLILGKKYHIETTKGEILVGELGRSTESPNAEYFFSGDFGLYDVAKICRIAPYTEFSYVAVGNGFALTKNGSKIFPENVYGVIDDEQHAQYYIFNMNNNANTYTPDTIHRNDIVECIDGHFYNGDKAIVTEVRKPNDVEDHGTVEVYMLDKKFFEHFTYTGWNQFLKVVEAYD